VKWEGVEGLVHRRLNAYVTQCAEAVGILLTEASWASKCCCTSLGSVPGVCAGVYACRGKCVVGALIV